MEEQEGYPVKGTDGVIIPWSKFDPWKDGAQDLGHGVAASWMCQNPTYHTDEPVTADHQHTINCLWIWHDCQQILGPDSEAPGDTFGWRPSGVRAHTLVQVDPLTITASVYWPECCGMHGFITNGKYLPV